MALEFIEEFKMLLLNNASRVLGILEVSNGWNINPRHFLLQ
ncbi:hypothetical protein [Dyadobacter luteus]|nr:hypothetical protein [Dyadobacter luteus]